MLSIGLKENHELLSLYIKCLETNNWFGYKDKIQSISLPNWVINKFNIEEQVL